MADETLTIELDVEISDRLEELMNDSGLPEATKRLYHSADLDDDRMRQAALLALVSVKEGVVYNFSIAESAESGQPVKYNLSMKFSPPQDAIN